MFFKLADTNQRGTICFEEFKQMIQKMFITYRKSEKNKKKYSL